MCKGGSVPITHSERFGTKPPPHRRKPLILLDRGEEGRQLGGSSREAPNGTKRGKSQGPPSMVRRFVSLMVVYISCRSISLFRFQYEP